MTKKKCLEVITHLAILLSFYASAIANPNAGFVLPDSVEEMHLRFRNVRDLIVIPVTINRSVNVNLILDTGCRSLVLFGKKFEKLLKPTGREVGFSGLGDGHHVTGKLSVGNHVRIKSIVGQNVGLVVVADRNMFSTYADIDGVIGYDIFIKFEIEINSRQQLLKFRPAQTAVSPWGYTQVPLQIIDSKPVIDSQLMFSKSSSAVCGLMIDTGSTLGLLLRTDDHNLIDSFHEETVIGQGLNGILKGVTTRLKRLIVSGMQVEGLPIGVVRSESPPTASIGMAVLKDYVVIINYCKSYACFKAYA